MALQVVSSTANVSSPAAETVVTSIPPLADVPTDTQITGVIIRGNVNVLAGTGATAVVIRCRLGQNTVVGTLIGEAETVTLAAGASGNIEFEFEDPAPSDLQTGYTITIAETGATAAGTVNNFTVETDIARR